jgi:hypothetical protein
MAYHVNALSRQQKELFDNLIDYNMFVAEDIVKYSHIHDAVPSHFTTPPQTVQGLRHRYLIGDHGMLPNLPTAPRRDIYGHVAIYVRDCIKDILRHGVPIELYGTWEKPYTGSTITMVAGMCCIPRQECHVYSCV